jgi:nitrogen fixation/metabolism regulation signal transduction histidine kinase
LENAVIKRSWLSILPLLGLFLLIIISLYFMGYAAQRSDRFGDYYIWLLFLNIGLLVLLALSIFFRLADIFRDFISGAEGARLTWRLVLMFVFVALVPVLIVWAFSVKFLGSGIDTWFDVHIEDSLADALELSQRSLDYRKRVHLEDVESTVREMREVTDLVAGLTLNDYRLRIGAEELTLLGFNNRIIATSSAKNILNVPKFPSRDVLIQLARGDNYVAIEPTADQGLRIRVVVRIRQPGLARTPRVLIALFPISGHIAALANTVEQTYAEYKEKGYLRRPLKQLYRLTLSLVLLLSTLFAIWAAFFMARRLLSPISELAEATRAVAEGDYRRRLPVMRHDELGFLVRSFNAMTARIRQSREAAELSQKLVERQRSYLQAVLGHLSSGVLTLDRDMKVRTVNEMANQILEMHQPLEEYTGQYMVDVARTRPVFQAFYEQLKPELEKVQPEWQTEVRLFGERGRKVLICRGVRLPSSDGKGGGQAIVIDDVTNLIKAQRDAAWGEVARRLAHEIKNPLTPIQLSAERIAHKLSGSLSREQDTMVQRTTQTIIKQVEAMKDMVNSFRDYARTPPAQYAPMDLNQLMHEVIGMYEGFQDNIQVHAELASDLPTLHADATRLRQVAHNLIKNALEAMGEGGGILDISTANVESSQGHYVELRMRDSGEGIQPEILDNLFEPYVTNKNQGSGLGLAIVKKIVEDHGGVVIASNSPDGGARFIVRLPHKFQPETESTNSTKEGMI